MPTVPVAGQYHEGERFGGENDVAGPELSHGGLKYCQLLSLQAAGSLNSQHGAGNIRTVSTTQAQLGSARLGRTF